MKDAYRAYDGTTIDDSFALLEFVNWLRGSTRDVACVLLSEDARGRPYVPLDRVRAAVGSRAVTVLLSNAVQQSARNQLDTVDPYHGAAAADPHDAAHTRRQGDAQRAAAAPAAHRQARGQPRTQGRTRQYDLSLQRAWPVPVALHAGRDRAGHVHLGEHPR